MAGLNTEWARRFPDTSVSSGLFFGIVSELRWRWEYILVMF